MHIVLIAAEFAPLVKAGGLGEVLVGLSRELSLLGHRVEVILPKYDFIPVNLLTNLQQELPHFTVWENSQEIGNTMWSATFENIQLKLLEAHHPANYFKRGEIYGFPDDALRFIYFSKAAIEFLKIKQTPIDIIHLHDWHTAVAATLAKNEWPTTPVVLSIHNLEYQGPCGAIDLIRAGIHGRSLDKFNSENPQHPGSYNLLKGGIEEADAIIPVSPTYAQEILAAEYGYGLEATLAKNHKKITGILNGIDETLWDPGSDTHLKAKFNPCDPLETIAKAKIENQNHLAKSFGITPPKKASWVGAITRLVRQKGPEFLEAAIEKTIQNGGVFALLGSAPTQEMHNHFEQLKVRYKDHPQVLLHLKFDESIAHQLYAALDFILLPSIFEPCGLAQLIGMHYGAVPIVRSTGGLRDTVFDTTEAIRQNGYLFEGLEIAPFLETLDRAMNVKKNEPARHEQIMKNGLATNIGWKSPAKKYLALYQNLFE
jgi:starch synthase